MTVERYCSGKKVLDCGTVYTFDKDGGITLKLKFDETFAFDVVFNFPVTEDGVLSVKNEVVDNALVFTCKNFKATTGSGTTTPVNIATYNSKAVYLAFWVQLTGENSLRKMEYTIYIDE